MIGIVDYGAGNIQSVMNALSFCGAKFCLARSPEELLSCDKALLPGVGAFGEAIDKSDLSKKSLCIKTNKYKDIDFKNIIASIVDEAHDNLIN